MKVITSLNFILSLVIFPLVLGFFNEPLLLGLSVLYCSSASAFLSFGFNKKYIEGHLSGKLLTALANATLLISIIVAMVESVFELNEKYIIISVSTIVFLGGCLLLFLMNKNANKKPEH